jgi:hypothetical protein
VPLFLQTPAARPDVPMQRFSCRSRTGLRRPPVQHRLSTAILHRAHEDLVTSMRLFDRPVLRCRRATSPLGGAQRTDPVDRRSAPRELRSSKRRPISRKSGSGRVTKSPVAAAAVPRSQPVDRWLAVSPVTTPRRPETSVGMPTIAARNAQQLSICHWSGCRRTRSVPDPGVQCPRVQRPI